MSDSLERSIGISVRVKLSLHLAVCAWCRRYLAQIKLLRRMARRSEVVACSANVTELSTEARRRIAVALVAGVERDR